MPRISNGLKQAYDLQDLAYNAAMVLRENNTNPTTGKLVMDAKTAVAVQKLIGAWELAQERIRIHRNKPLPGSLRPTAGQRRGRGKAKAAPLTLTTPQPQPGSAPETAPEPPSGANVKAVDTEQVSQNKDIQ
jgi:hypothetical protein